MLSTCVFCVHIFLHPTKKDVEIRRRGGSSNCFYRFDQKTSFVSNKKHLTLTTFIRENFIHPALVYSDIVLD